MSCSEMAKPSVCNQPTAVSRWVLGPGIGHRWWGIFTQAAIGPPSRGIDPLRPSLTGIPREGHGGNRGRVLKLRQTGSQGAWAGSPCREGSKGGAKGIRIPLSGG